MPRYFRAIGNNVEARTRNMHNGINSSDLGVAINADVFDVEGALSTVSRVSDTSAEIASAGKIALQGMVAA